MSPSAHRLHDFFRDQSPICATSLVHDAEGGSPILYAEAIYSLGATQSLGGNAKDAAGALRKGSDKLGEIDGHNERKGRRLAKPAEAQSDFALGKARLGPISRRFFRG